MSCSFGPHRGAKVVYKHPEVGDVRLEMSTVASLQASLASFLVSASTYRTGIRACLECTKLSATPDNCRSHLGASPISRNANR